MKTLHKYIISEMLAPFFVGFGFFTFIFILNPILQLVDLIIVKNVDFMTAMKLFLYLFPSTIAIVLPMATLVAVLMALGRLSSDSEVIAMRACGINHINLFMPVILFALLISIVGVIFNDTILPIGNYKFKRLHNEIVQRKPLAGIEEHTLTAMGSRIVGIDRIDKKRNRMYGIVIFENIKTGGIRTITAKRGFWLSSSHKVLAQDKLLNIMRLQLEDGSIEEADVKNFNQFNNIIFKKMIINFTEILHYFADIERGTREKTTGEIMKEIKRLEKSGEKPYTLWTEYHKRFSIPFAALAFVLLGAPFGIVSKRSGKSYALGVSILVIIVYYLLYTLGETLGREGKLNGFIALWLPNFIFFILGAIYIYRINSGKTI